MTRNNSDSDDAEYDSAAAAFDRQTGHDTLPADEVEEPPQTGGAPVPEDHPRAADSISEDDLKQLDESNPDPREADNVPDHECDNPDAPWSKENQ